MKKQNNKSLPFRQPVYPLNGRAATTSIDFEPLVFGIKPNELLVAQAVRVYLARRRQAHPKVKSRGEVKGSTRKIWAQKGTGRARHGDRYAPIFVGGGRAHGPRGEENWQLKMPKKMRQLALFSVLSDYYRRGSILAVDGWQKLPLKTRAVEKLLAQFLSKRKIEAKRIGLLLSPVAQKNNRGWRNLKLVAKKWRLESLPLTSHPYQLLRQDYLLCDPEAIKYFNRQVK